MSRFFEALVFLFVGIALSAGGNGQGLSDEEARQKARATMRRDLGLPESSFLNPHRREDLEESVLSFERNVLGRSIKQLYFFEVTDEGYEITSQQIVSKHAADDGHSRHYVAIDRAIGETYRLYGFKDAANEFNRMATNLRLSVETETEAELFALFYFKCVFGSQADSLIYSKLAAKHRAEDYFHGYADSYFKSPGQSFDKWSRGFDSRSGSRDFGVRATKTQSGFGLTLTTLETKEGELPRVQEYNLEVRTNGQCKVISITTLYK